MAADDATFAGLLNALTELVDSGGISHDGLIRSLEAKFDAGSAAQERGNVSAAIGSLEAFRNGFAAKRETQSTAAFERLDGLAARLLAAL